MNSHSLEEPYQFSYQHPSILVDSPNVIYINIIKTSGGGQAGVII